MPNDGPAADPVYAEVHLGEHVIRYRRSGAGGVVLLLGGEPWPELEASLAWYCRVLVPVTLHPAALPALLEGLGVSRARAIVLDPALAEPVTEFATADPEAIASVAVVRGNNRRAALAPLVHFARTGEWEDHR